MSHRLADGSMSTDYEIGDEFHYFGDGDVYRYHREDGSSCPWFTNKGGFLEALSWSTLKAVKAKKNSTLINQLHETIRQLKATIKELES
jgi:hypothetical protein